MPSPERLLPATVTITRRSRWLPRMASQPCVPITRLPDTTTALRPTRASTPVVGSICNIRVGCQGLCSIRYIRCTEVLCSAVRVQERWHPRWGRQHPDRCTAESPLVRPSNQVSPVTPPASRRRPPESSNGRFSEQISPHLHSAWGALVGAVLPPLAHIVWLRRTRVVRVAVYLLAAISLVAVLAFYICLYWW